MVNPVSVRHEGELALVIIDNPPINAMSAAVRQLLVDAFEALQKDRTVQAVVLACAGKTFVAGADIAELGKTVDGPDLRAVIAALEAIAKPTLAAIHGTALGGGLELAMGCHFRVADAETRLGLPEVNLGILPGAGGTVRLPRLVSATTALRMIVTGASVDAGSALAEGLLDAIIEGDLLSGAIDFARQQLTKDLPSLVRHRDPVGDIDLAEIDRQAADLLRRTNGLEAPTACVQAVRNAVTMPFDLAQKAERQLFERLVTGEQSQAQRYLFFATRQASKVPGIGPDLRPRDIGRVGVVGAGTMGGGIAMAFANAGFPVTLIDATPEALDRGLATIDRNYAISISRGTLNETAKTALISSYTLSTNYADLADCDLIVEAVFEDMAVKKAVFAQIDAVARPGAILATNTSYLDIDEIAAGTKHPDDFVGLHFFSPANVMKLLEIVRGARTSSQVVSTALAVSRKIGKVPVVVGVCHGFVGNRMLAARNQQLDTLLLEGALPQQVDRVFIDFGWRMGPFAMWDLAGLDIGWRNRKAEGKTAFVADALCQLGRFGQKTGKGVYIYQEGSRTPRIDPDVGDMIERMAAELNIARRAIPDQEIIERTLYPMINEGTRILEEGIALRASDIDVVWTNGYGFPVSKGGPMFFADRHGLGQIADRLEHWHVRSANVLFAPSALIRNAVKNGSALET